MSKYVSGAYLLIASLGELEGVILKNQKKKILMESRISFQEIFREKLLWKCWDIFKKNAQKYLWGKRRTISGKIQRGSL